MRFPLCVISKNKRSFVLFVCLFVLVSKKYTSNTIFSHPIILSSESTRIQSSSINFSCVASIFVGSLFVCFCFVQNTKEKQRVCLCLSGCLRRQESKKCQTLLFKGKNFIGFTSLRKSRVLDLIIGPRKTMFQIRSLDRKKGHTKYIHNSLLGQKKGGLDLGTYICIFLHIG